MTRNMLFAGFGGQGILFAGKIAAYCGLVDGREVSWLPSYGPEMRGGTANCGVCISDEPVGSPLVTSPDTLVVMNLQSYEKFIDSVVPGGLAIVDSSLINKTCDRTDITVHYVPATALASEHGLDSLANMILMGKLLKETGFTPLDSIKKAMEKSIPASKRHLIEANLKAIELGAIY